jgi:NAD(P)-dependent dehydrogenase (short-subunit alcohol dehydrogenase family)
MAVPFCCATSVADICSSWVRAACQGYGRRLLFWFLATLLESGTTRAREPPGQSPWSAARFARALRLRTSRGDESRVGEIDDVVDGILYLERATFVTGEILHIDGGQAAGG